MEVRAEAESGWWQSTECSGLAGGLFLNHLDSSAALCDFAIFAFRPLFSTEEDKRRERGDTESRGEESGVAGGGTLSDQDWQEATS